MGNAIGAYSNVGIDIENKGDITQLPTAFLPRPSATPSASAAMTGIHIDNEADITAGDFGIRAKHSARTPASPSTMTATSPPP